MFCGNCGYKIENKKLFCGNCGYKVEENVNNDNNDPTCTHDPNKNHPYKDLGGFLSFLVYGGYVACILTFIICVFYAITMFVLCSELSSLTNTMNSTYSSLGSSYSSSAQQASNYTNDLFNATSGFSAFIGIFYIFIGLFSSIFYFCIVSDLRKKVHIFWKNYFTFVVILSASFVVMFIVCIGFINYFDSISNRYFSSSSLSSYMGNDIFSAYSMPSVIGAFVFFVICIAVWIVLATIYVSKSVRLRTYMGSNLYIKLCPLTANNNGPEPAVPDEVCVDNDSNTWDRCNNHNDSGSVEVNYYCGVCNFPVGRYDQFCSRCGSGLMDFDEQMSKEQSIHNKENIKDKIPAYIACKICHHTICSESSFCRYCGSRQ